MELRVGDEMPSREETLGEVVEEARRHLVWLRDAGFRLRVPAAPPRARRPAGHRAARLRAPATSGAAASGRSSPVRAATSASARAASWPAAASTSSSASATRGAELVFVGEGPGADEDQQGEPFVGKAGQLLTKMIEAMGFRRDEVYIANVVKCRPPGNRNPEPDEIEACEPFLRRRSRRSSPR